MFDDLDLVQRLKNAWQASWLLQESEMTNDGEHAMMHGSQENIPQFYGSSFLNEIMVQTVRTFKTTERDPMGISGCLAEAII